MPALALIFVLTIAALMTWPIVLSAYFAIGLLCFLGWWNRRLTIRILSALVSAVACVSVHLTWLDSFTLSSVDEMREIVIVGQVSDLPERTEFGQRFHLSVSQFDGRQLSWWQQPTFILSCYSPRCEVSAGERWQFTVKVKKPHGLVNFYGFDYEQYLFANHVKATGSVVSHAALQRLTSSHYLAAQRQLWYQFLQATKLPYANVIAGLGMGADDEIDHQIWDDLRRTGTTHLIAISGMHIVLIAFLTSAVVGWLWRAMRRPPLWLATPYVQAIAGVIAAVLYAAIAGFSVPTVRALLMTLLLALLLTRQRKWSAATVLSVVAVLMLLVDPCSILLPGFCLSFAAVAILLWLAHQRYTASLWRHAWRTQWILSLSLMPLTLLLFDQVSIVSALVNLLAVPWISFICTPLALLGIALISIFPTLAHLILSLCDQTIHYFIVANHLAAQWQWSVWQPPQLSGLSLFSLVTMMIAFMLPAALQLRKLTLPLLIIFLLDVTQTNHPYAALTVLDVGQGLAITIETSSQIHVYDAGPRSAKFDAGRDIVAPHVRARGFNKIDTVFISHADNDHAGGALSLRDQFPVRQWRNGEKIKGLPDDFCRDGQHWTAQSATFSVLAPRDDLAGNPASCVIKVQLADTTFLLTGDVEKEGEAALLHWHRSELQANVLVVPHHGSKTSSTADFLAAVAPQLAVVSAGYLNRFGHPKPDVMRRYDAQQIAQLNTAFTGAIRWQWQEKDRPAKVDFARAVPRRWRAPQQSPLVIAN